MLLFFSHQIDAISLIDDFPVDEHQVDWCRDIEQAAIFYDNICIFAHLEGADAVIYTKGPGRIDGDCLHGDEVIKAKTRGHGGLEC